jgi:hypothetical protein
MERDEAFEVLGLPNTATPQQVRDAYLRLSRKVHSDTGGSDALFRQVKLAYDTLNAPGTRHDPENGPTEDRESQRDRSAPSAPLVQWVRSKPSLALFLAGLVALLVGIRVGGAVDLALFGVIALVVGLTGLLGVRATTLSAGDRSGGALLLHQMRAGAPRLLRALSVGIVAMVTLLALIGFARDHSYDRRHRH